MLPHSAYTASNLAVMLAWMDLEMTGLLPERNVILEIAMIVTDDDLNTIEEFGPLVIHADDDSLGEMEKVVTKMHEANGLLADVRASTTTLEEANLAALAFLKRHCPNARQVPLCGNSIGTDRRFLARYMPDLENWLHYRSVDVSSIKELAKRWYPGLADLLPKKDSSHRALDDIRDSIAELQYYREHLFVKAPAIIDTHKS
ncbi:oligoribonuclease [Ferrimicrobium sp.]|uniref:oligoribonuclease n=2 Tax=Ferrimicrobium sp. TaxID=2926050 RepID=UPI00344BBA7F